LWGGFMDSIKSEKLGTRAMEKAKRF